jgi:hypothetical protein
MSRIPIWKDGDPAMPEGVREAIDYAKGGIGFALNVQREMANNSKILEGPGSENIKDVVSRIGVKRRLTRKE